MLCIALLTSAASYAGIASRDEFKVLQQPTRPLDDFSGIKLGTLDTKPFLESIKTEDAHERYLEPTALANQGVRGEIEEVLPEIRLKGKGPALTLVGDLISFRTGSATARAGFGMMSNHGSGRMMGTGHLWYEFHLMNGKQTVASYKIVVLMKSNKKGAYHAVASYLRRVIEASADPLP